MKTKLRVTIIVLLVFSVYMAFFDQHSWLIQRERTNDLNDITNKIEFLTKESERMETNLHGLQYNHQVVEQHAREKYFHKRDGEDVYIIKTNADSLIDQKVKLK